MSSSLPTSCGAGGCCVGDDRNNGQDDDFVSTGVGVMFVIAHAVEVELFRAETLLSTGRKHEKRD